jgi:polysaccharide pyruvyl transferase WcaK-like protein
MKRIAVCGEIYSSNLGDQAIHACLLHLLEYIDAGIETISLDLSGRNGPVSLVPHKPGLWEHIAALESKPVLRPVYGLANAAYQTLRLKRLHSGPWGDQLASAQSLLIGGGQLLMDDGLNFPFKVAAAAKKARQLGLPYHFSSCGVGQSWSVLGRKLFEQALSESESVTLRDHLSQQRLSSLLPGIQTKVTFDPAVWAAAVYPVTEPAGPADWIGLGVIDNESFNARSARNRFSAGEWMELWLDLLAALLQMNRPVLLFTTGSPADQRFGSDLYLQSNGRGWQKVALAAYPVRVPVLTQTLRSCKVVIAARLHAAVLANAFGIAAIGLEWDEKVRAYYDEIGRPDQCFALDSADVNEIASTAWELYGQPFPIHAIDELRERALENARVILKGGFREKQD